MRDRVYAVGLVGSHTSVRPSVLVHRGIVPVAVYDAIFAPVFVWEATSTPDEHVWILWSEHAVKIRAGVHTNYIRCAVKQFQTLKKPQVV